MTKEQIINALKDAVKPYEEYYIDDKVVDAINTYSNPYEFVAPILEIIADNPTVDFGMPGELVHFVEQFYKNGYEELLIASVSKKPTPHNIWMLQLGLAYAKDIFGAKKISLGVFENNERAYHCYKATGFQDVSLEETEKYTVLGDEWRCLELEIQL